TADTVQPMLGHRDCDRRQLRDLVPPRQRRIDTLPPIERARARLAPTGPMLDDLVDPLERKQPPMPALMPGPTASPPTRPLPARTRRRPRWVRPRRKRRV